jgi:serine acetyltransferase
MTSAPALPSRSTTLRQKWQRLIQTCLWRMDIHPSAWIAPTALIDRTWPKGIHVAAGCVIDHQAVVLTHDMTRGVYLDTRIGANCIIEPGSVVNRDVPDGSHMMGNPAKPVTA